MGIKLMIEVLDGYHGPDARKLWLLAWAEKANDRTRAGWPTRDVLSLRTGRSPSRVSHIADELVTEGVLRRDGGGNRSGPARFILPPLEGTGKGAVSTHPKDAPEGAPRPHSSTPGKGASRPHPKSEVKGAESARKGADAGPQPAETSSLPLIIPSVDHPSSSSVDADAPTAQTILKNFIDWVRDNDGDLTKRTIGQIARQIGELLEQGIPDRYIRKGLADWHIAGQHAATLDSFVNAARNAAMRGRAMQGAAPVQSTTDQRVAQAQALKAKFAGNHQEPA